MKLVFAGATDVGCVRDHNEDSFAIAERHRLCLVADGMGGHELGEVASKLAADAVVGYYDRTEAAWQAAPAATGEALAAASGRLVTAIELANRLIFQLAIEQCKVMGTTIVAAHIVDHTMCVAHVGDSRAYLVREGSIAQLTRDHSALEDFKQTRPDASPEEIESFPYRNVIMRALGTSPKVAIDTATFVVGPGDLVLLCCDGLSNKVSDDEMLRILSRQPDLQSAAFELILAANEAEADDNVTAVLARCEP